MGTSNHNVRSGEGQLRLKSLWVNHKKTNVINCGRTATRSGSDAKTAHTVTRRTIRALAFAASSQRAISTKNSQESTNVAKSETDNQPPIAKSPASTTSNSHW